MNKFKQLFTALLISISLLGGFAFASIGGGGGVEAPMWCNDGAGNIQPCNSLWGVKLTVGGESNGDFNLNGNSILNVDLITGNSVPLKLTGSSATNYLTVENDDVNSILNSSIGGIQFNASALIGVIEGTEAEEATFLPLFDLPCGALMADGDECSITIKNDSNTNVKFFSESNGTGGIKNQAFLVVTRFRQGQGSDVASATNIVLPNDGNTFELTGTTKVDLISSIGWDDGDEITLICNDSVTIDDGTATSGTNVTLILAGSADFSCTADDLLTLKLLTTNATGQAWFEKSRSAN